ncbi:MAG: hypothetical protein ACI4B9_03700, partial [Eggerthellaceae bacterium]
VVLGLGGAAMKQTDYPELPPVADLGPENYIVALYKGLGWDGESLLDPTKVTINQQRWLDVCREFNELPIPGVTGYIWMNSGPSADADVPYRAVRIETGAFNRNEPSLSESDKAFIEDTVRYRYDVEGHTVHLDADLNESNEFLLQQAYDSQSLSPEDFLRSLRDAVDMSWENGVSAAIDDIIEHANITPFPEGRYEEARDYLIENYSFEPPYSHYFDQGMKVNVLLGTEAEKNLDFSSIGVMRDELIVSGPLDADVRDNALTWLVEQQGHTLTELKDATAIYQKWGFDAAEITHGTFIASVAEELNDFSHIMGSVTVLAELSINDMAKTLDPSVTLTIPKDATIGIFAPWVGGGSALDIQLEKDLVIPFDKRFDMQIEGAGCREYTVNNVYGLVEEAWKRPIDISSPIQDREKPLDDLMKEAKQKAAEKNITHRHKERGHKPPELGL